MTDLVNHPSHYAEGWSNGAEVIDITENLNFNRGNAVKYIARAGKKDPAKELEDLQKAELYLKREIARITPVPTAVELDESNVTAIVADLGNIDPNGLADWERELLGFPRQWQSLRDIPAYVRVKDRDDDVWTAGDVAAELTYFEIGDALGADIYAPFIEFPPRVWESLVDVPEGVKVKGHEDVAGHWESESETGYTGLDYYGPFTEIMEDE